jgi:hypothetical protein
MELLTSIHVKELTIDNVNKINKDIIYHGIEITGKYDS